MQPIGTVSGEEFQDNDSNKATLLLKSQDSAIIKKDTENIQIWVVFMLIWMDGQQ